MAIETAYDINVIPRASRVDTMESMTQAADKSAAVSRRATSAGPGQLTGEIVYLYAFDIAYEMTRFPVKELLGQPVETLMPGRCFQR